MRSLIPIWASKAVSVKGENLGFFFHETFNDFNDATDVIKEQKLEYLNLKMKSVNQATDLNYLPLNLCRMMLYR